RRSGPVADLSVPLVALDPNSQYSLLYSLTSLTGLGRDTRVEVEVRQGNAVLASKTLHAGDADYYTQFRVPKAGPATVVVRPAQVSGNYALQVNRWPRTGLVKSSPARRWQDAVRIPLGQTVFASGDDENYVPLPGTTRRTPTPRAGDRCTTASRASTRKPRFASLAMRRISHYAPRCTPRGTAIQWCSDSSCSS